MKLTAVFLLQVARGLVLPFTTLLSYIFLASKPTPPLLAAIGIVCVGFMVGVSSEKMSSVSYIGIILGVCSSVTTAGHAIVVKRSLPVVNGSAMDLAYYSNFLSAFIMAPAAVLAETGAVVTLFSEGGKTFRTFWVGGLVTVSPGTIIKHSLMNDFAGVTGRLWLLDLYRWFRLDQSHLTSNAYDFSRCQRCHPDFPRIQSVRRCHYKVCFRHSSQIGISLMMGK